MTSSSLRNPGMAARLALGLGLGMVGLVSWSDDAKACSAEGYLGSVCATIASYCPNGFAEADGASYQIGEYTALYAIIGNFYGRFSRVSFDVPNLRGNVPLGRGRGLGLYPIEVGDLIGLAHTYVGEDSMPLHDHGLSGGSVTYSGTVSLPAKEGEGDLTDPTRHALAKAKNGGNEVKRFRHKDASATADSSLAPATLTAAVVYSGGLTGETGGTSGIPISEPRITLRYCIAVDGLFPPRQ